MLVVGSEPQIVGFDSKFATAYSSAQFNAAWGHSLADLHLCASFFDDLHVAAR